MRKHITAIALAGVLGLGTATVASPALAAAATSTSTAGTSVGDRLSRYKDALTGLVTDGTLTQDQADKVATTLDTAMPEGGHGRGFGRGMDLAVAAEKLGITEDELRTELEGGKSLADVAESKGVDKAGLISDLVAAAETDLAQAVTDGKLTQAQADEQKAALTDRITRRVEQAGFGRGGGRRGGIGADDDSATSTPTATATAS